MEKKELKLKFNIQWDEKGFFKKLRYDRVIDFELGHDLLRCLQSFELEDNSNQIDRDLVRLLWYIPQFMDWQREDLIKDNSEEDMKSYVKLSNNINNELERILGMP